MYSVKPCSVIAIFVNTARGLDDILKQYFFLKNHFFNKQSIIVASSNGWRLNQLWHSLQLHICVPNNLICLDLQHYIYIYIYGLDNSFSPVRRKPLSQPLVTYSFTTKCRLQNDDHYVRAPTCECCFYTNIQAYLFLCYYLRTISMYSMTFTEYVFNHIPICVRAFELLAWIFVCILKQIISHCFAINPTFRCPYSVMYALVWVTTIVLITKLTRLMGF